MPTTPPLNVNDALRDGGLPENWTRDQLIWIRAKHVDLATRARTPDAHALWRLRWAFTCADLLRTIQSPGAYSRLPRSDR